MTFALKRWTTAALAAIVTFSTLFVALPTHAQEDVDELQTSDFQVFGQMIELSSTSKPTTIVVRHDPTGTFTDYTVDITEDTFTPIPMDDWLVGDYVNVWGTIDENTGVVTATQVNNNSMNVATHRGLNGWIDWIADDGTQMGVQWQDVVHTVNLTENTHLVGDEGPHGDISDFQVGDRVRLRLIKDSDVENEARIVMILRRGPRIFNLARTRGFYAELLEIDTETNEMNVLLLENPHLWDGDVNNLIGVEGDEITVTYTDDTNIRRKFFGKASDDELVPGDRLQVVGRADDSGVVEARMIRDTDIFKFGVAAREGNIQEVNTEENYFVVIQTKNLDVEDAQEWTIYYSDDTEFYTGRDQLGTETDLVEGMYVRVRGTANTQTHTVTDVVKVAIYDEHKPFKRRFARIHGLLEDVEEYEGDDVEEVEEGDSEETEE